MNRLLIPGCLFACLIFCSGVPQAAAAPPEQLTFSVLYNQSESAPFSKDWLILSEYKSRRNVELDVMLGDNADYQADVARVLESGQAPDIILKIWPNEIEKYATSGLLIDFNSYTHLMPHFSAYIQSHHLEGEIERLNSSDEKLYILPGFQRTIQVQQWIYRKDLFDSYNLGVPDNYDELYQSLVFLHERLPNSCALTACWGGAHLFAMMGAGYGIPAGWNKPQFYNAADDTWQFSLTTNNYKDLLRFLHRCFEAGIFDPDIFTQSVEDYYAKIQDGRAIVTVTWISSGFDNWNRVLRENGVLNGEWAPMRVPESTSGIRALPPVDPFRKGLIVPSKSRNKPYFDELMRFIDWAVYSEEGMTLTDWGVDGITYNTDGNGKRLIPDIFSPKTPQGTKERTRDYGLATLFDLNENSEFEDYKKPAEIVRFLEASAAAGDTAPFPPVLKLDTTAIQAIDTLMPSLISYATEASKNFIAGTRDIDSEWNNYIDSMERLGLRTLEAIWNLAWDKNR